MIRIFLASFLVSSALAAAITFVSIYFLSFSAWNNDEWIHFQNHAELEFRSVSRLLENTTQNQELLTSIQGVLSDRLELLSYNELSDPPMKAAFSNPDTNYFITASDQGLWQAAYRLPKWKHILLITKESAATRFLENINLTWFFIPLTALLVSVYVGCFMFIRYTRKPVDSIVDTAEQIGSGNFTARAITTTISPIDKLAACINLMAQSIQSSFVEREMLLSSIPHELKTPLARVRFLLELCRNESQGIKLKDKLDKLEDSVIELESVVNGVSEITRLNDEPSVTQTRLNLSQLCIEVVNQFSKKERSIIEVDIAPEFEVHGNAELLSRALKNVVSNSIRYARSKCLISVKARQNSIFLSIEDDGIGIAKSDREKILDPFATGELSRSKKDNGVGLGLALVKLIMTKHFGIVNIKESRYQGCCVEMSWPGTANNLVAT